MVEPGATPAAAEGARPRARPRLRPRGGHASPAPRGLHARRAGRRAAGGRVREGQVRSRGASCRLRRAAALPRHALPAGDLALRPALPRDRKSTRLNSSHVKISYAVFCLKKKNKKGETWYT